MPYLYEVRKAKEIGRKGRGSYMYLPCANCQKPRWVFILHQKPVSHLCRQCNINYVLKHRILPPYKPHIHSDEEKRKHSQKMKEWHSTHTSPMQGRKHSEEAKRKMSLAQRGNKNGNWKGGLTKLIRGIRRSPEYYQWRKAVLERDSHTCQDCGAQGRVDAHHMRSIIDCPEGIFEVENGLALCEDCHKRHTFWQRLKRKGR